MEFIDKPTIYCILFQVARDAKDALREIANNKLKPQVAYEKARGIK